MSIPPIYITDITPIETLEALLIATILSGVFWNVLEGYRLVPAHWLPTAIILTTVLLASLFVIEAAWPTRTVEGRYRY